MSNPADTNAILEKPGFITLAPAAYFAVDVFFFLGGFLAAVLVLEKITKIRKISIMLIPSMWLHRLEVPVN
jgi:peptidoglycan/LPS O-acetylase OafA/YrhL